MWIKACGQNEQEIKQHLATVANYRADRDDALGMLNNKVKGPGQTPNISGEGWQRRMVCLEIYLR